MGAPVPQDDLPSSNVVPPEDLPDGAKSPSFFDKATKYSPLMIHAVPGGAGILAGKLLDKLAYKGGGAVTDVLATHVPPEVAAGAGLAANVAIQAAPSVIGGEVAKFAAPAFQRSGSEFMQSALKPTKSELTTGKGARAIQTMLDEGLNVTPGGVAKLRDKIAAFNDEIATQVVNSTATVNKGAVTAALQDAIKKFEMQATPQADVAVLQRAWGQFLSHPLLAGKNDIPVQLAQSLKQGTYRALGSKSYGELKGADIEAQKALARGLKDEIAKVVPGIAQLNKAESELLNAEAIASARVLMDANKNPMGLGWLAMHPATWLGFAADRSPFIKSLLARGLYSGAEQIPATAGRIAGGIYGASVLGAKDNGPKPLPRNLAELLDQHQ